MFFFSDLLCDSSLLFIKDDLGYLRGYDDFNKSHFQVLKLL